LHVASQTTSWSSLNLCDREKLNIENPSLNGNFRILKWRYVSTIFLAIFLWGYSLKLRPYIGLIYGRYLQFRFLTFPLKVFILNHDSRDPGPAHQENIVKR
jgi:hypothetical protein